MALGNASAHMLMGNIMDADMIRLKIRLKPYLAYYEAHPEQLPMEIANLEKKLATIENSDNAASDQARNKQNQQSSDYAARGLCRFCGGKLSLFGSKCKSCGKKN